MVLVVLGAGGFLVLNWENFGQPKIKDEGIERGEELGKGEEVGEIKEAEEVAKESSEPEEPEREALETIEVVEETGGIEETPEEIPEIVEYVPKLLSWQKETGIRVSAISSCTIFRDNQYWMYYTGKGIALAISNDGLNFELKGTVIHDDGPGSEQEMVTNPAVFQLKTGGYRMIYEGSQDMNTVRKLYSAVSNDGLKWFKEDGIRLEDDIFYTDPKKGASGTVIFASVPDVIRLEDNCLRIYYAVIDEIRIAKSCDEGLTWQKEGKIMFDIYPEVAQDPDIIMLEDGTYKLFFSAQNPERTKGWIVSASSEDGINFKIGGKIIEPSAGITHAMDSDAIRLPDGRYRLYYSEGNMPYPEPNILSAISKD